ncbi:hypothetical protein E2C01_038063 [Portunus trituberculatus]|uniref:Uncharacterized protein n=1 Tax=Portunus trituberculatus TaxID=210409 RepID=A0A5B7F9U3_PORTR|nr:hypothetical protein [Portunus trituberculatus]
MVEKVAVWCGVRRAGLGQGDNTPDRGDRGRGGFKVQLCLPMTPYAVTLSSLLGSSDHNLISEPCLISPILPQDAPKRKCLWHFAYASWGDLKRYYADFPWNDYCFHLRDPSLCVEHITEKGQLVKGNKI